MKILVVLLSLLCLTFELTSSIPLSRSSSSLSSRFRHGSVRRYQTPHHLRQLRRELLPSRSGRVTRNTIEEEVLTPKEQELPVLESQSVHHQPHHEIESSQIVGDEVPNPDITHEEHITHLQHDENGQCIFVKTEEGVYSYTSPGVVMPNGAPTPPVCGLYVISEPDQVVELEFEEYNVERNCPSGGLVSVINGWELNGQFFPGVEDHPKPKEARYHQFCRERPLPLYTMDQNVGLVEFRLPLEGEGFKIRVRFRQNPKPCNVVLQKPQGVYTLRNYGERINCTASIIFPESFRILSSAIGLHVQHSGQQVSHTAADEVHHIQEHSSSNLVETGIIGRCRERGLSDYVELRGGDGLDPAAMEAAGNFCGMESMPAPHQVEILCGNTAVRLVSSGSFDNSVTFAFDLLLDLKTPTLTCPTLLESL